MKKNTIFLLLLLGACDYYDHRLEIINQTKQEISVETYPDTIPEFPSPNKTEFYLRQTIMPNDSIRLTAIGKNGWPFTVSRSKNKRLNVIVYSVDSLRKYNNIDSLIKYRVYKVYEFSEDDIRIKKWKFAIR